jgi:nickel-dependent lactate racemase
MLERLRAVDYLQLDQWMLQDHCNVLLHAGNVMVFTEHLSEEWLEKSHTTRVNSLDEGLSKAFEIHGQTARVAVMPQGPYVIARVREPMG